MDEGNKVSSVCTKASNEDQDRQMKIAFEHMTSDVIIRPPNFQPHSNRGVLSKESQVKEEDKSSSQTARKPIDFGTDFSFHMNMYDKFRKGIHELIADGLSKRKNNAESGIQELFLRPD